jgi:hypothetical protein
MRRIVLPSVASAAIPYFPHYLINGTAFGGKKITEHKISVLIFSKRFV